MQNQLGALLIARRRPEEARRVVDAAMADWKEALSILPDDRELRRFTGTP